MKLHSCIQYLKMTRQFLGIVIKISQTIFPQIFPFLDNFVIIDLYTAEILPEIQSGYCAVCRGSASFGQIETAWCNFLQIQERVLINLIFFQEHPIS